MNVQAWTFVIVGLSFALYIGIAVWSRAKTTSDFYVAGKGVPPLANGLATAADWMSAASFIGMAGLISFGGYDGSVYLMGWTGGYVLLALLLAPYLRKFGKYTVPDFVGDRYYSQTARVVAVVCAIFVSFTYVAGQMRGVGVVFSRFLEVDITIGVVIGMGIVFFYAVLGGMKGITYTQVAQYCVLIFAYLVPAIFISILLTNNPVPQIGFGGELAGEIGSRIANGESITLLDKLDQLNEDLGFAKYTDGSKSKIDVFMIAMALMVGTAGLPHVIIRFYTVPKVRDARKSALWALVFIAILYTTAAAVGAFGRINLIDTVQGTSYAGTAGVATGDGNGDEAGVPEWFRKWEDVGLLAWVDKNEDGRIQYYKGAAFTGKPVFAGEADDSTTRGGHGERLLKYGEGGNTLTDTRNELYIDRDIMVLANPEIAGLPDWVVGLVAAGGLAAALSTAAGLLLVVSTSISHDLLKRALRPQITERGELLTARIAAGCAVCLAGYLGVNPPDYVAAVVAFAFGLAASSFFPVIIMGIFSTRMNKWGAISGMSVGIVFTASYIIYFKFYLDPTENVPANWFLGISPEGIGTIGMLINFVVAIVVSSLTPPPPDKVRKLVHDIRLPADAGEAHEVNA